MVRCYGIDLCHSAAMLSLRRIKSFVLHGKPRPHANSERAGLAAVQKQSCLFSWDSTWPPSEKCLYILPQYLANQLKPICTWKAICFCEIRPCTNNIVYASVEVFNSFLYVFVSVFRVFVRLQPQALFIWSRVPETTLPLETTLRSIYMEL